MSFKSGACPTPLLSDRRKGPGSSGCPKLRAVAKRLRNHSSDEGKPVVAALSSRFLCLGARYTGASCSPR